MRGRITPEQDADIRVTLSFALSTGGTARSGYIDGAPVFLAKDGWDLNYVTARNPAVRSGDQGADPERGIG